MLTNQHLYGKIDLLIFQQVYFDRRKDMVDRFEAFTYMISEVSQYWNKIAALEMKKYGLKGLYALYLVTLSRHSDGITAAELSEISNKDKAEISRAVSVLEKNNLVKRCNNIHHIPRM